MHYIANKWVSGKGEPLVSENPATSDPIWKGHSATKEEIDQAVLEAKKAFYSWSVLSVEDRIIYLQKFKAELEKNKTGLTEDIAKEIGKPLWEAKTEVEAIINKIPISIEAYQDRSGTRSQPTPGGISVTRHRPHGVVAVFGPFNFPGHLPNGHIIPALLAGNTVVFKPSELAPLIAERIIQCWEKSGLPKGVINLVQGNAKTGERLSNHPDINGLFFTGSYNTGVLLSQTLALHPEKILALEMGGNNPLVVHEIGEALQAAVYHTIQSAYLTSGQRCTCARRLIVTRSRSNEEFVKKLIEVIPTLQVGPYTKQPEPFMGPVISNRSAEKIVVAYEALMKAGAIPLVPLKRIQQNLPFLSPGVLDVTSVANKQDQEIFGPLLQLIWVENLEHAFEEANKTAYGLAAGLLSAKESDYQDFLRHVRAGVVNWNRAITGAASKAPFGGIGRSGNHRPSAYYAADYCAYPVASLEETTLQLPSTLSPGVQL